MITPDMIKTWHDKHKSWNREELLNYYFKEDNQAVVEEGLFMRSYRQLCEKLPQEVKAGQYKSHILLVGFSIQPVLLSVLAFDAERLIFLYTYDSRSHYSNMVDWLDKIRVHLKFDQKLQILNQNVSPLSDKYLVDSSDPADTYRKLRDIVEEEEALGIARENIAVDITGGKKSMVGGAFLQAAVQGCDIYYVDFQKYDVEYGPEPGTEFLKRLPNPYELFNERELIQVKELFGTHNYAAAEMILSDKGTGPDRYVAREEMQRIERLRDYAEIYKLWDAFDYQQAASKADGLAGCEVLRSLCKYKSNADIFKGPAAVLHCAVDRFQNAERRRITDRLDDAIIRYTQVIEFLCRLKYFPPGATNAGTDYVGITKLLNKVLAGSVIESEKFGPFNNQQVVVKLINIRHSFVHYIAAEKTDNPLDILKKDQLGGVKRILKLIPGVTCDSALSGDINDDVTPFDGLRALAFKFLQVFHGEYPVHDPPGFKELLKLHRFLTYNEITRR